MLFININEKLNSLKKNQICNDFFVAVDFFLFYI